MSKSTTTQTTRAARNTGPEPEPAGFIVDLDDIARDQARTDHNLRIPQEGLAQVAIDAAIGARERRRIRRDGVALIVEIPGADWAPEVEAILRSIGYFETVVSRSGASPKFDRPTEGNDKVAMSLASGRGVLGISSAPERFLPEVLVAAADVRVKLRAPGPREIATVIRMATGAVGPATCRRISPPACHSTTSAPPFASDLAIHPWGGHRGWNRPRTWLPRLR